MSTVEKELIEKIGKLSDAQKQRVLEFVRRMNMSSHTRSYSARELMALPPEERKRRIQEAFDLAADEDFEIFEAY